MEPKVGRRKLRLEEQDLPTMEPDAGASAGDRTRAFGHAERHRAPSASEREPPPGGTREEDHALVRVGSAEMPAPFALRPPRVPCCLHRQGMEPLPGAPIASFPVQDHAVRRTNRAFRGEWSRNHGKIMADDSRWAACGSMGPPCLQGHSRRHGGPFRQLRWQCCWRFRRRPRHP